VAVKRFRILLAFGSADRVKRASAPSFGERHDLKALEVGERGSTHVS